MHQHMEEQLVMAPGSELLIYLYLEAIIQLGFIVFFACVFLNLIAIRTCLVMRIHRHAT